MVIALKELGEFIKKTTQNQLMMATVTYEERQQCFI